MQATHRRDPLVPVPISRRKWSMFGRLIVLSTGFLDQVGAYETPAQILYETGKQSAPGMAGRGEVDQRPYLHSGKSRVTQHADSDEAGHAFQSEAGQLFRCEAGRGSDLKSATLGVVCAGSWLDDVIGSC